MVTSWMESEWDEDQRLLVEAGEIVERLTGTNGEWMPDATADGADPNNYATRYRYVANGPHTNWAEKARLDALDEHKKTAGEKANLNGLYFGVERVDY